MWIYIIGAIIALILIIGFLAYELINAPDIDMSDFSEDFEKEFDKYSIKKQKEQENE